MKHGLTKNFIEATAVAGILGGAIVLSNGNVNLSAAEGLTSVFLLTAARYTNDKISNSLERKVFGNKNNRNRI